MTTVTRPTRFDLLTLWDRLKSNYLLQKIAQAIFVVWFVTSVTFFVVRAMPGNAVDILIQDLTLAGVSPEDARNQASLLIGLDVDKPLPEQYGTYLLNTLRGDLGQSYKSSGLKVSELIVQVLPWTLFSVGLSLMITFTLGIALGAIMAYNRDTWIDHLLSNLAATLDAVSPILIGLLAILLIGVTWKMIPISDMRGAMSPGMKPEFSWDFIADIFMHVRVLLLVYVLSTIGSWMLQMKSSTIATLGEDYVTVARARGLTDARILTAYVGRNATLPLFTRLAISIGFAVGGSVLLETLFTYRGVGFLLAKAILERDYPVMQGVFLITTTAVVFANLLVDFVYGWLDPRIRIAGGEQ
ncbi:MAG: ABC transporter permease [Chloroflexi bacterium]|nr:ABC transporter permease [Chloroflexota bacterium]MBI5712975.1 ABC transporter permease [Chloroflexota bacterium]